MRIVIAEDNQGVRTTFIPLLQDMGHTVVGQAETGQNLVDLCRKFRPDVVITDVDMPGLDGLGGIEKVAATQPIPFVVVSGYDDPKLIKRAGGLAGFLAYLVKPVTSVNLQAALALVPS